MDPAASVPGYGFSMRAFSQGLAAGLFLFGLAGAWCYSRMPALEKERAVRAVTVTVALTPPEPTPIAQRDPSVKEEPAERAAPVPVTLPPAPMEGLYEETPNGRLPKIDEARNLTPFEAYKRPFDAAAAGGRPVISLVVSGLGLSKAAAEAALTVLPPEVSFSLSPYGAETEKLGERFREAGHETWIDLPSQSAEAARADGGPLTLLIDADNKKNLDRLSGSMASAAGYAGLLVSDPAFFSSAGAKTVLAAIGKRGLSLAGVREIPVEMKIPAVAELVRFDTAVSRDDIAAKLRQIEEKATRDGKAAAVIQPLPLTYREIGAWIETLPQKGYVLAPLSAQAVY